MSSLRRNPPRFVPTLTQVVETASVSVAPDVEHLVQLVLKQIDARLERRLREVTELLVQEQLQNLRLSLGAEMEPLVRQSVAQAMSAQENQNEMK